MEPDVPAHIQRCYCPAQRESDSVGVNSALAVSAVLPSGPCASRCTRSPAGVAIRRKGARSKTAPGSKFERVYLAVGVQADQFHQQHGRQGTMNHQPRISLIDRGIGPVVVDAMAVERESRKAKQQSRIRDDGSGPGACRDLRKYPSFRGGNRRARLAINDVLLLFDAQVARLGNAVSDGHECQLSRFSFFFGDVSDDRLPTCGLTDQQGLRKAHACPGEHALGSSNRRHEAAAPGWPSTPSPEPGTRDQKKNQCQSGGNGDPCANFVIESSSVAAAASTGASAIELLGFFSSADPIEIGCCHWLVLCDGRRGVAAAVGALSSRGARTLSSCAANLANS